MKETEMIDVLIGASYEGKTPSPFVKEMGEYVEVPVGGHTTYWLRVPISQKKYWEDWIVENFKLLLI